LGLKKEEQVKVSKAVAEGCTGSAQRFIDITSLLLSAQYDPKNTIETAVKFSKVEDGKVKNFLLIFRYAYLESGLDLDLNNSIKMALNLSLEFEGEFEKAREDFTRLVEFCLDKKSFNLALGTCGKMAARVTKKGEAFEGDMSTPFVPNF
jgi:hypothetical protein